MTGSTKAPKRGNKMSKKNKSKKGGGRGMHPDHNRIMHLAMQTCGVTNPFCPEAIGSKWPDNSNTKSVPWSILGPIIPISSDAQGKGAVLFLPVGTYKSGIVNPAAGNTTTDFSTGSTAGFATPPSISRYRVTSWGIKMTSPASKMVAAGTVHLRIFSPEQGTTLTSVDITTPFADFREDVPIQRLIDKDGYVFPMPLGIDARMFTEGSAVCSTSTVGAFVNNGWQVVCVGLTGAPASTAMLTFQPYFHFELILPDGDGGNAYATKPPAPSPLVQEANANLLQKVGNFIEGGAKATNNFLDSEAYKLISRFLPGYWGGPRQRAIKDLD